jgi:hypothetical protein
MTRIEPTPACFEAVSTAVKLGEGLSGGQAPTSVLRRAFLDHVPPLGDDGRMRRLRPDVGRRLLRGELIVLFVLVAGAVGFGVPASAVFGKDGDSVVGWITVVPILVCGAVCRYVALILATRDR